MTRLVQRRPPEKPGRPQQYVVQFRFQGGSVYQSSSALSSAVPRHLFIQALKAVCVCVCLRYVHCFHEPLQVVIGSRFGVKDIGSPPHLQVISVYVSSPST